MFEVGTKVIQWVKPFERIINPTTWYANWFVKEVRGGWMLLESEFKTEGPRDKKGFDWRWVVYKMIQLFCRKG